MSRLRGFVVGVVFAAVGVGFAFAMPIALQSAHVLTDEEAAEEVDSGDQVVIEDDAAGDEAGDADDEAEEGKDNHGAAVSVAAKCDVKGRAHGKLVSSIAKNKEATVADAEAACEAAKAAASEEPSKDEAKAAKKADKKADKDAKKADKDAKKADKDAKKAGSSGEDEADDSADEAGDGSDDAEAEPKDKPDKDNGKSKDKKAKP